MICLLYRPGRLLISQNAHLGNTNDNGGPHIRVRPPPSWRYSKVWDKKPMGLFVFCFDISKHCADRIDFAFLGDDLNDLAVVQGFYFCVHLLSLDLSL